MVCVRMPKKTDLVTALIANESNPKTFLRRQRQHEELEHERKLAEIRAGSQRSVLPATVTERPPLHPLTKEGIEKLLHRVDQRHWALLAEMRVSKFIPLDIPVPPSMPEHLLNQIEWYASMLFKEEADQYEQFRSNEAYSGWLLRLVERVIARVQGALSRLEEGDPKTLLMGYHGLEPPEIEQSVRVMLLEIVQSYERGDSGVLKSLAQTHPQPETKQAKESPRETLRSEEDEPKLPGELIRLLAEARWKTEDIAEKIGIDPRNVYRHLSSETAPSLKNIGRYEAVLSKHLGRRVTLPTPVKRQRVSKTSVKRP
jgi:hypothetical protein